MEAPIWVHPLAFGATLGLRKPFMATTPSFAFLPRKVATRQPRPKHSSSSNISQRNETAPNQDANTSSCQAQYVSTSSRHVDAEAGPSARSEPKTGPALYLSDEECAAIVQLGLSDYAIWSDPDLRRTLDWQQGSSAGVAHEGDGYINTSVFLQSKSCVSAPALIPETQILRVVRAHFSEQLDIRLALSEPRKSDWLSKSTVAKPAVERLGAYEVRRRDWHTWIDHTFPQYSHLYWKERTLYLENIPIRFRTITTIALFVQALLDSSPNPSTPPSLSRIQAISLPPHHQDKAGEPPKCKGFAFLTLLSMADVEFLLERWPWDHMEIQQSLHSHAEHDTSVEVQDAVRFGFRCLSQIRWDELKSEYTSYKQRLLDEIMSSQSTLPPHSSDMAVEMPNMHQDSSTRQLETQTAKDIKDMALEPDAARRPTFSDPFPYNCLLFARNLHPETNKTTLRTLFSVAFGDQPNVNNTPIDYVDFNKGMDSCYLRLAGSKHSEMLIAHFHAHPIVQTHGLDTKGSPVSESAKAIRLELVQGKPEVIYWEKVPEKVRRTAVQKTLAATEENAGEDSGAPGNGDTTVGDRARNGADDETAMDGRKRKRRRRG
ncbi:hypothetical protein HGRIS_008730 [Hohenbuehelia grisea]|uniref:XRRM domain-containing protein n=1 Tax=Hohenbuehelia grisea TaxID=104357 RepID=A0ABR3J9C6_9AGAR